LKSASFSGCILAIEVQPWGAGGGKRWRAKAMILRRAGGKGEEKKKVGKLLSLAHRITVDREMQCVSVCRHQLRATAPLLSTYASYFLFTHFFLYLLFHFVASKASRRDRGARARG
jgi:hypothetical protein